MYQLADKNKVMSLFHKGQSVSQIRLKSNVSKSTLYRWKAEYDTTGKIIGYIMKGKLDAARREISQFQETHKNSSVLLIGKVINQFIRYGYLDDAKELAEELLEQYPNDLPRRSQLVAIAKQKENLEEVKRLCREILVLDPNNLPARSQLVTIAKQKGNLEEAEGLCREILALDPNNRIAKKQLKSIQRMQKWAIRSSKQGSQVVQKEEPKQLIQRNIQKIRNQIQAGIFLLDDIEARQKEMQEMGIDEARINLLLAEAYERQNLPKQTKTYLKKAFQGTQDPKLQKAIKALIETAQTKKRKPSHVNPWNIAASITSIKEIGQTGRDLVLEEK